MSKRRGLDPFVIAAGRAERARDSRFLSATRIGMTKESASPGDDNSLIVVMVIMMAARTAVMIVMSAIVVAPIMMSPFVMGMMRVRADNHGGRVWGTVGGARISVATARQN